MGGSLVGPDIYTPLLGKGIHVVKYHSLWGTWGGWEGGSVKGRKAEWKVRSKYHS